MAAAFESLHKQVTANQAAIQELKTMLMLSRGTGEPSMKKPKADKKRADRWSFLIVQFREHVLANIAAGSGDTKRYAQDTLVRYALA